MLRQLAVPSALLFIVPVAPALEYLAGAPPIWVFLTAAAATAVLADWVRRATEQLAAQVGTAIGGLLNISFGSMAELILAVFVLAAGHAEVVRAQITGSIIGTSLFGLGLAIVIGSIGREKHCSGGKEPANCRPCSSWSSSRSYCLRYSTLPAGTHRTSYARVNGRGAQHGRLGRAACSLRRQSPLHTGDPP